MCENHCGGVVISELIPRLLSAAAWKPNELLRITRDDVRVAGEALDISFPGSYSECMLALNGIEFKMWELYRVAPVGRAMHADMPIDVVLKNRWLHENRDKPKHLVSFYTNGLGDETCFDTSNGNRVVELNHERPGDVDAVAEDFEGWLRSEIGTLEWLRAHP